MQDFDAKFIWLEEKDEIIGNLLVYMFQVHHFGIA